MYTCTGRSVLQTRRNRSIFPSSHSLAQYISLSLDSVNLHPLFETNELPNTNTAFTYTSTPTTLLLTLADVEKKRGRWEVGGGAGSCHREVHIRSVSLAVGSHAEKLA